ncbi:hydroxymethylglutaryl-CoA synthase [Lentilactobacillus fungorum]|uniref:Hydroxymethylglutaryl-CoA synthase n=1 Tax=Lentilactobacillus fungorum TaxID=2201250 RepID=A0ABQ3VUV3_9LACO|nr:hydroxymethylglutaryl-CoA synthase [Lentilactobacillus fungorum]GHP12663.1 hydroxymethylglutaryl-CoA synthase [Lentilactobacillus fungorum]
MTVGIDKIAFFTSPYYIETADLAKARGVDPNKYLIGIGQKRQSVIPPTQDTVTLAANAAVKVLTQEDRDTIDMVILGTETGIDNSKAGAIYIQELLGITQAARAFEIKQACYGATAGVQMAVEHVTLHPHSKVLVIASDIARYGLKTAGEVTQGGGAVAMLISSDPEILILGGQSAFHSENIMDFWRPLYRREALVDGHYSTDVYIDFFNKTWQQYQQATGQSLSDFSAFVFHLPFTKMGLKALRSVVSTSEHADRLLHEFDFSTQYGEIVGNLYTGSLYLSLLSLLANSDQLHIGDRIGLFSYGSGAQGEFYSGQLATGFKRQLLKTSVEDVLTNRQQLTIPEYEQLYSTDISLHAGDVDFDTQKDESRFLLAGRHGGQLKYVDSSLKRG